MLIFRSLKIGILHFESVNIINELVEILKNEKHLYCGLPIT